jgi:hypothetical protein
MHQNGPGLYRMPTDNDESRSTRPLDGCLTVPDFVIRIAFKGMDSVCFSIISPPFRIDSTPPLGHPRNFGSHHRGHSRVVHSNLPPRTTLLLSLPAETTSAGFASKTANHPDAPPTSIVRQKHPTRTRPSCFLSNMGFRWRINTSAHLTSGPFDHRYRPNETSWGSVGGVDCTPHRPAQSQFRTSCGMCSNRNNGLLTRQICV